VFIQYAGGPSLKSLGLDVFTPDSLFGTTAVTYLQDTVASTVFELDATRSDSTDGSSQTWSNRTAVPADSASQTDYDFYCGDTSVATTDDPTFTGSVGSTSAYWLLDGGDHFSLKSGTNTTFLNTLHKTTGGADWWLAVAAYVINDSGGSLFSTKDTTTSVGIDNPFFKTGVKLLQTYDGIAPQHRQYGTGASDTADDATGGFSGGQPVLYVISHKHSTNETFIYINGVKTTLSQTYNTTTASAARKATIGRKGGGNLFANLTRIYAVAMGNTSITDGIESAVRTYFEEAHARSYSYAPSNLSATVTSTVFQIDANNPTSVPNPSTTADVINIVASPADGSAQAAYDLDNVGNLIVESSRPYDSYIKSVTSGYLRMSGAATAFAKDLHKTTSGQDFWVVIAGRCDGIVAANTVFATLSAFAAAGQGVQITTDVNEDLILNQAGTSATSTAASAITGLASGSVTDFLLVLTYSHSGNTWRYALNAGTFTTNAHTFATSTTDGGKITLSAENDGGDSTATNDFFYRGFAMGNSYIDDTELAKIVTWYETNHNINYVA